VAGNYQFNLPIPAGCCITKKAFLVINFVTPAPAAAPLPPVRA
jgi:hypothetical protein